MTDNLVERLREKAFRTETYELLEDAADRIEKLEAALREIASASKVVARNENIAEALAVLLASHRKIARKALEGKND